MFGWIMKLALQALSALPFIAEMAFQNRNYIIAYLHLVLLGFISVAGLAIVLNASERAPSPQMKFGVLSFLSSLVITELLLAIEPTARLFHFLMPAFPQLMFFFSCVFPVAAFMMAGSVVKQFISSSNAGSCLVTTHTTNTRRTQSSLQS